MFTVSLVGFRETFGLNGRPIQSLHGAAILIIWIITHYPRVKRLKAQISVVGSCTRPAPLRVLLQVSLNTSLAFGLRRGTFRKEALLAHRSPHLSTDDTMELPNVLRGE